MNIDMTKRWLTLGAVLGLLALTLVLLPACSGGSNQKNVGAMRSAAPAFALGKNLPFSWRAVPVTTSGDFCIEKGAAVSLIRPRTKQQQAVILPAFEQMR